MVSHLPYVLLVGALEHFSFSISYMGCHPKPIDELNHFSRWLKAPTRLFCSLSAQRTFGVFSKEIRSFSVMNPVIMLKVTSTRPGKLTVCYGK